MQRPILAAAPAELYWQHQRRLNRGQLAERSHVARSAILRRAAGFSTLYKVAAALEIQPEQLRQPPEAS
jgi:hypothetical protein